MRGTVSHADAYAEDARMRAGGGSFLAPGSTSITITIPVSNAGRCAQFRAGESQAHNIAPRQHYELVTASAATRQKELRRGSAGRSQMSVRSEGCFAALGVAMAPLRQRDRTLSGIPAYPWSRQTCAGRFAPTAR